MDVVRGHISYAHTPPNEKNTLCLHIIYCTYRSVPIIRRVFLYSYRPSFAMITGVIETLAICRLYHLGHFLKKVVARLTEHDDVIKYCSEGPRA